MIRKLTKHKKSLRREANYAAVKPIYDAATQGVSLAATKSDPVRVAKIQAEAQERRDRRGQKTRVLAPKNRQIQDAQPSSQTQYTKLPSGQLVGHPETMRVVKRDARQRRLQRRAAFREGRAQ